MKKKVRYAVVGLGHIAQVAVLPAIKHAASNSELTALISNDPEKLKRLGRRYQIKNLFSYEQYNDALQSGLFDAVYITLPNHLHRQYAVAAADAGIHVLCEKPLGVTESDCQEMISSAQKADVKLMTAYRLHFEEANLFDVDLITKRKIGEPKIFNSVFTIAVDPSNYRGGPRERGGGPMYDLGIYCTNAARYLFQDEPIEVSANRFGTIGQADSEESMAVTLRFSKERIANFVCSFGSFPTGSYQVVGTKGVLNLENAYEYVGKKQLKVETTRGGLKRSFASRDQFAPEVLYFSCCILGDREPEPSGIEGLKDIRIICAAFESARLGRPIRLEKELGKAYPDLSQEIHFPPIKKSKLVRVKSASKDKAA